MSWHLYGSWPWVGVGLVCLTVADAAYSLTAADVVAHRGPYDFLWSAGALAFAVGATRLPGHPRPSREITGWPAIALPLVAQAGRRRHPGLRLVPAAARRRTAADHRSPRRRHHPDHRVPTPPRPGTRSCVFVSCTPARHPVRGGPGPEVELLDVRGIHVGEVLRRRPRRRAVPRAARTTQISGEPADEQQRAVVAGQRHERDDRQRDGGPRPDRPPRPPRACRRSSRCRSGRAPARWRGSSHRWRAGGQRGGPRGPRPRPRPSRPRG